MNTYLKFAIFLLGFVTAMGGCGDDPKSNGGNRRRASSGGRSGNLNRNRRRKKVKKAPNVNFFADENLSIPPFNKEARNIPPEMFIEKDKIQRDPFKNLYQPVNIGGNNINEQQSGNQNNDTIVLMEQSSLAQIKLTGIVWSAGREKALFVDTNNQPTVVMKGDVITSSKATVKEITHDKVILEISSTDKNQSSKNIVFVLDHRNVPYQIQYDKLKPDQRGIRVHTTRRSFRRAR